MSKSHKIKTPEQRKTQRPPSEIHSKGLNTQKNFPVFSTNPSPCLLYIDFLFFFREDGKQLFNIPSQYTFCFLPGPFPPTGEG